MDLSGRTIKVRACSDCIDLDLSNGGLRFVTGCSHRLADQEWIEVVPASEVLDHDPAPCAWCGDPLGTHSVVTEGDRCEHEWCFGLRVKQERDDARREVVALRKALKSAMPSTPPFIRAQIESLLNVG